MNAKVINLITLYVWTSLIIQARSENASCRNRSRRLNTSIQTVCDGFSGLLRAPTTEGTEELHFTKNYLTSIDELSFPSGSSGLEGLSLDYNKISHITPRSFQGLSGLTKIDLSHNKLKSLHYDLFVNNKRLRTIDLSFNEISHLNVSLVSGLDDLEELCLSGNPLNACDPNTAETLNFLQEKGVEISILDTDCDVAENAVVEAVSSTSDGEVVNTPNGAAAIENKDRYYLAISVAVVALLLLVLLILLTTNVLLYKKLCRKMHGNKSTNRSFRSTRRVNSGNIVIRQNRASLANSEVDEEGYLRSAKVRTPHYLEVLRDNRQSDLILLQSQEDVNASYSIKPLSERSNVYEKIPSLHYYSTNICRSAVEQPYARPLLIQPKK